MEKYFVTHSQAVTLKELGFDEPCISWYTVFGKFSNDYSNPKKYNSEYELGSFISAPLKSQVFEWGRKNHSIHSIVSYYGKGQWNIEILDYKGNELIQIEDNTFWSYEEAESACIDKLIEIVKSKKQ